MPGDVYLGITLSLGFPASAVTEAFPLYVLFFFIQLIKIFFLIIMLFTVRPLLLKHRGITLSYTSPLSPAAKQFHNVY